MGSSRNACGRMLTLNVIQNLTLVNLVELENRRHEPDPAMGHFDVVLA